MCMCVCSVLVLLLHFVSRLILMNCIGCVWLACSFTYQLKLL